MKVSQEKKIEKLANIGFRIVGILGGVVIIYFGVQAVNKAVYDARHPKPTDVPAITSVAEEPTNVPTPTNALPTNTPTPAETATPTPTYKPDSAGRVAEIATPTPMAFKEPFLKATDVQNDIVPCLLYTLKGNYNTVLGRRILFDNKEFVSLITDFGANTCRPIPLSEVTVGDVAYKDGCAAICVGFYKKHPIFAYFGDENYANYEYNIPFGSFLGYAASDVDELFCGCAPINIDEFYDSGYGKGDNDTFLWYVDESFRMYDFNHFSAIYDFGRALSKADGDKIKEMFYTQELEREGLVWTAGYPDIFCRLFTIYAGSEQYVNYSLLPTACTEYENYGHNCYEYTCSVISLDPATYLETSGTWSITVIERDGELKIMPHSRIDTIRTFMSAMGLAPEVETTIAVDENGNEYVVYADAEYGFTTDEDGRIIYRASDGTVMGGFEEGSEYALASGGSSSYVYDLLEKSGWIIDRNRNAYYEGEYWEYDDVRYYGNGAWYDIDTDEKIGIEVNGCYDWWYYIIDDVVYFYYYKEETPDGKTKYWGDLQYSITDDGRLYYMLWDTTKNDYSWFVYDSNTYEIVFEMGYYYVNCVTTGDKYVFRLVPEGSEKEMWLLAGQKR